MFTSVLTIDSNEFTDSGSYCCVAAVIGSGDSNKMSCVILSVLGKINTSPMKHHGADASVELHAYCTLDMRL